MRLSRPVLAAPAVVLLLCGLTACGSADAGAAPSVAPTAAAAEEAAAPEDDALDATNFTATFTDAFAALTSYDFAMTTSAGAGSMSMSGSAHLGDAPAMAMVMDMDGITIETRQVGGLSYMKMGALTGDKFLQIDPDDTSNPLSASVDDSMGGAAPTAHIAEFEKALVSVTRTAEAQPLDGTEVDVYEVVVDPRKMPERMAELEQSLPAGAEVPETITYTISLDPQARARKLAYSVLGTSSEVTYTNFDNAAPVAAPTADEITSADSSAG